MEAGAPVCVDLRDLGLDVTLRNGSSGVLEDFDGFAKMFHSLFVCLLSELVVSFLFQGRKFVLDLLVVSGITLGC